MMRERIKHYFYSAISSTFLFVVLRETGMIGQRSLATMEHHKSVVLRQTSLEQILPSMSGGINHPNNNNNKWHASLTNEASVRTTPIITATTMTSGAGVSEQPQPQPQQQQQGTNIGNTGTITSSLRGSAGSISFQQQQQQQPITAAGSDPSSVTATSSMVDSGASAPNSISNNENQASSTTFSSNSHYNDIASAIGSITTTATTGSQMMAGPTTIDGNNKDSTLEDPILAAAKTTSTGLSSSSSRLSFSDGLPSLSSSSSSATMSKSPWASTTNSFQTTKSSSLDMPSSSSSSSATTTRSFSTSLSSVLPSPFSTTSSVFSTNNNNNNNNLGSSGMDASSSTQQQRPVMHTFYELIPSHQKGTQMSDQADRLLLQEWTNTWEAAGWDTRILTLSDAKKHPDYESYAPQLNNVPMWGVDGLGGNIVYNQLCFLRWLAMAAVGGGFMSDYDVFPLSQRPADLNPMGDFTVYSVVKGSLTAGIPCLMSGRPEEWTRLAHAILENGLLRAQNKTITMWSDMLALIDMRRDRVYRVSDSVVEGQDVLLDHQFTEEDCQTITRGKLAVHFSHEALRHGHIEPGETPEHRAQIVHRFLSQYHPVCTPGEFPTTTTTSSSSSTTTTTTTTTSLRTLTRG